MQYITNFFSHPFFVIGGGISFIIVFCSVFFAAFAIIRGNVKPIYRLGMGLSKEKIAIFSDANGFNLLKSAMLDSGLANKKKIDQVSTANPTRLEQYSFKILDFTYINSSGQPDLLQDLVKRKAHADVLLIYCPAGQRIPEDDMKELDKHGNISIVNSRSRLLSDMVLGMITNSYNGRKR